MTCCKNIPSWSLGWIVMRCDEFTWKVWGQTWWHHASPWVTRSQLPAGDGFLDLSRPVDFAVRKMTEIYWNNFLGVKMLNCSIFLIQPVFIFCFDLSSFISDNTGALIWHCDSFTEIQESILRKDMNWCNLMLVEIKSLYVQIVSSELRPKPQAETHASPSQPRLRGVLTGTSALWALWLSRSRQAEGCSDLTGIPSGIKWKGMEG